MNTFAKRYIDMKQSHPDIAKAMPHEAAIVLHNTLYKYMKSDEEVFAKIDRLAWTDFFNERVEEYEYQKEHFGYYCLEAFGHGNCAWAFSMIDFLLQEIANLSKTEGRNIPNFAQDLNKGFERINYGYRIVGNHVTPITDQNEISEIDSAINEVTDNVKDHLNRAIQYLSDELKPDYRNSIKESLSAVEAFCYKYTKKGVLTDSLKVLDKKGVLHPRLKNAFDSLYNYSSEKNTGSRHGRAIEDDTYVPTYYEAKFMLVACTTFINYLKGKFCDDLGEC